MTKILARIVIDPEDWNDLAVQAEDASVVHWKRMHTSQAIPFSEDELDHNSGAFGNQYFF